MYVIRNLLSLCLIILFCSSFVCSFPSPEEKDDDDKSKEDTSDSEKKESEKELGSVSPEEMDNLKNEILENQEENADKFGLPLTSSPDEVVTFLEKEEEKYGEDLPNKIEEDLNAADDDDDDEFKSLVNSLELIDKIEIESSDTEEKEIEKSPAEMKEMKAEVFKLTNELNERKELPPVSQEQFDKVWDQKEEKYGKMFPAKIEKVIHLLKLNEDIKEAVIDKEEKVPEPPAEISTEVSEKVKEIPKDAFAVKSEKGKVCILAKFHAIITISFPGKTSEMKAEVPVPETGEAKGKCRDPSKPRSMHLSWDKFNFTLMFNKTSEDMWAVTCIEFSYDTSVPLFDGAANPGKVTAKSKKENWFETPLGKSYVCPAQEVILLYSENEHVATVRMKDTHLQPYDVEDGKFSSGHRCNQVVIDGLNEEPFVQDETIPLAVGCTLALITLLILVGFSVHRAYNAAKVDYNTME